MKLTILSKEQKDLLAILKRSILLDNTFYLAGGTGLALILAHRKSVDFDFFSKVNFYPLKIIEKLKEHFPEEQISLIEMKEDTLIVFLKNIQTSFFYYHYSLLKPLISEHSEQGL